MNNLDATTPQLKLVDQVFEAYRALDPKKCAHLLSKNFRHRSFPKIAEMPDQTKEEHIALFGPMLAMLTKLSVRT